TDNGNDVVKIGSDITIPAGKKVDGSVVAIGGSVTVLGEGMQDVVAVGGDVTVKPSGIVHGDAGAVGGTVREDPSSTVAGETAWIGIGALRPLPILGVFAGLGSLAASIALLLVLMLVALVVLVLARDRMEGMLDVYHRHMGKAVVYGLIVCLLFPV